MAAAQKPESEGTAVAAPREITTADLPALIASSKTARNTILPFLPEGVSLDRVAASLRVALAKDKAAWEAACRKDRSKSGPSPLERCSPMSVFMSVAKITQWGLEVGETAHLVPFGDECTPVADYKGLAQLVIASGVVRHVETHCVYEKEPFRIRLGTSTEIEHHPIGNPKARGEMIGAYALFRLRGGVVHIKYMDIAEIDAIRQRYSKQWKGGPVPSWYAEKTPLRQGVKLLPKDPRLAKTLAAFDDIERAELSLAVPAELRALESGEEQAPTTEHRGPRAITEGGYASEAQPAAQRSDDPAWSLDDAEPAELDLGEERSAPTRRRTSMDAEA